MEAAAQRFADTLQRSLTDTLAAQPEDQLKGPVQALLRAAGASLGLDVDTRTEVRVEDLAGRPGIGVTTGGLLCGHVELKAPGKGARVERLKGADRGQWEKFKLLSNLIYTDGCEWALYRAGERRGKIVDLGDELPERGAASLGREAVAGLADLLRDFLLWEPVVPTSPRALAELLADLCRLLRADVTDALAREDSALARVAAAWRRELFPDADARQVADAYSQTLTYALLLARFEGHGAVDTHSAEQVLERKHGLLARSLRVLGDPQVRQEIGLGLGHVERAVNAIDLTALRQRTNDPWLYFYEDFLAAYDAALRNERGVYYTPVEVIQAQCRLVEELLRKRLRRPLGFADEGVVVLDPGAGTGAYLQAVVQMGLDRVEEQQGAGAVPGRASALAENVHGFEILVGPYAVAHLRLTQAILAAGGELPADGAHVYLADTLENPYAKELGPTSVFLDPLAEEHRRAKRVKAETRVLVCLGNPPYDREQLGHEARLVERKGGWIRRGEAGVGGEAGSDAPLNAFLDPARKAGHGVHLKNLYNDYVYFWRWALWKVFEEKKEPPQPAQAGIVSFITAASYLRGPGFVGMRQVMRQVFDELWIIDLEGGSLGARKTENVFAITTPVAIAVGVRYGEPRPGTPARVRYARLEGTREAKLERLASVARFADLPWRDAFEGWMEPFLPRAGGGYFDWPLLTDLFPWQHSGVQFKRTWPSGETREVLVQRWKALLAREGDARALAFRETRDRRAALGYSLASESEQRQPPLAELPRDARHPPIVRFGHRSLDRKWILRDSRLGDFLRPALWSVHGERQVYLTSLLTDVLGSGPAAMVCAEVPDLHHFRGSFGGKDVVPLWRDAAGTSPNVTQGLLSALSRVLGARVAAEDLFAYCYGVLATPRYVERFWDELTLPGPRVPLTRDRRLFRRTERLGRRLVRLHTFGERFTDGDAAGVPQGLARCTRPIPSRPDAYPVDFEYDRGARRLRVGLGEFSPVSHAVWDYSVSGFSIVQSWLGGRMRERAGRASSILDDIRPERWTAGLTEELLELLWTVEATLALLPELDRTLEAIADGSVVPAGDLPAPADFERRAPLAEDADEEPAQRRLPGH